MITDDVKWNGTTRSTWCKENIRYKHITRKKQKIAPQK